MKNKKTIIHKPLHIQSNGGGVQSMAMYMMSSKGILPRFDYSIFIDLGTEKPGTYAAIEFMKNEALKKNGIPLIVIKEKNLLSDTLDAITKKEKRFVSIPFFSTGPENKIGMLRRQCTGEYKIRQVNAAIKQLYGLSGNQRFPETFIYIGISLDEAIRMSSPEPVKFTNVFPFLLLQSGYKKGNISFRDPKMLSTRLSRNQLIKWLSDNNIPLPPKSSCIFCPYTSNKDWLSMKKEDPRSFEIACSFDDQIRKGKPGKVKSDLFIHKEGIPLREVNFSKPDNDLFTECEGFCHT